MNKLKKELIDYLNEQIEQNYFYKNPDDNINGYKCAIKDLEEYLETNYGEEQPKGNMLKCSCCGKWIERHLIFEHKTTNAHLCFTCY